MRSPIVPQLFTQRHVSPPRGSWRASQCEPLGPAAAMDRTPRRAACKNKSWTGAGSNSHRRHTVLAVSARDEAPCSCSRHATYAKPRGDMAGGAMSLRRCPRSTPKSRNADETSTHFGSYLLRPVRGEAAVGQVVEPSVDVVDVHAGASALPQPVQLGFGEGGQQRVVPGRLVVARLAKSARITQESS